MLQLLLINFYFYKTVYYSNLQVQYQPLLTNSTAIIVSSPLPPLTLTIVFTQYSIKDTTIDSDLL